ncbi:porin [Paraburkholderia sediminicola]|uniref:porin n=1 Tax=Paraburkholderia sp. D1E TaxID=3461398 RepID=UPI000EACBF4F
MKTGVARALAASGLLAVSALSDAQSNVTLYGDADAGLYYQSKTPKDQGSTFQFMDSGMYNSDFGIEGTEDLGGGMHAGFKLESGYQSSNGAIGNSNGGLFGRNAYVELGGNFGTARAGVQYSPFFMAVVYTDPRGFPDQASGQIPYLNNFGIAGLFTSDVVTYTTPSLAGFVGSVMFGPGGVAGNFKAGKQESFSLRYKGRGLDAELGYLDINDATGATAQQGRMAGASYTWAALKVSAAIVNYRMPTSTAIRNVYVYSGGLSYNFTPAFIANAGVYFSRDQDNSANRSTLGGLGVLYLLSKRTSVYAQIGVVNNKGIMGTGLNSEGTGTLFGFPAGTTTGVNVGIDHRF